MSSSVIFQHCGLKEFIPMELNESINVYPCKKKYCCKFHKSENIINSIMDSIYFLKPSRLEEIVQLIKSANSDLNKKINLIQMSELFQTGKNNLLNRTLDVISDKKIDTIVNTKMDDGTIITKDISNTILNITPTNDKYLKIISIICGNFPQMITQLSYTKPNLYTTIPIINILNKYNQNKTPSGQICCFCKLSSPNQMIKKPCKCCSSEDINLNSCHLTCLTESIYNNRISNSVHWCQMCSSPYDSYSDHKGTIHFPNLGIYFISSELFRLVNVESPNTYVFTDITDKKIQLNLASRYLCVKKVKEILDSMSNDEFKLYAKTAPRPIFINVYDEYGRYIILEWNIASGMTDLEFMNIPNAINLLFLDKMTDTFEYKCKSDIKMSFGKYLWCGNMSSPTGSGFTLVNYESTQTDLYGSPYTHTMLLELNLNPKLLKNTDFIDMYDNTGFLMGYNVGKIAKKWLSFKKIKSELIGTEIRIVFSKKRQLTKEQEEQVRRSFTRIPRDIVYEINVKIPELMQYGDKSDCNICLDAVEDEKNRYISPCGHLFHLNCIFKYLETKNLLYPTHPQCLNRCCNAKKIKPFECVVCKNIISK
jgi:hypothetical protein